MIGWISRLRHDPIGSMAIETALVAPALVLLGAGTYDASAMVARQTELQSAAAEATSIVLAASPETQAELDNIEDIVEDSTGLTDSQVTLTRRFRCGTATTLINDLSLCANSDLLSTYIELQFDDTYTPVWTHFGIGSNVQYNVDRMVQIS